MIATIITFIVAMGIAASLHYVTEALRIANDKLHDLENRIDDQTMIVRNLREEISRHSRETQSWLCGIQDTLHTRSTSSDKQQ